VVRGPGNGANRQPVVNAATGGTPFDNPVDYIGTKTISNHITYADQHIATIRIPGCDASGRVFVGQLEDPFAVWMT